MRALAFSCAQFGIKCKVFMVKVSYYQKPYRRSMMRLGQRSHAEPSQETEAGRKILAETPTAREPGDCDQRGRRGGCPRDDTKYTLGSVLNHVMLRRRSPAWRRSSR